MLIILEKGRLLGAERNLRAEIKHAKDCYVEERRALLDTALESRTRAMEEKL